MPCQYFAQAGTESDIILASPQLMTPVLLCSTEIFKDLFESYSDSEQNY